LYLPSPIPACKFCGRPFPQSNRRRQGYCSSACRQAAYRKRSQESVTAEKAPTAHPAEQIAPTVKSAKNVEKFPNDFKGRLLRNSTPSIPLNVFGRGYRWPGAKANGNATRISAAVDAELGVGAGWLTSPGGALYQIVPRRAR
jgi:hypothetical protein